MKEEITIVVPKDFSAVTLRDYLPFHKDLETYQDEGDEAVVACVLHHFSKVNPKYVRQLDTDTYIKIKNNVSELLGKEDYNLKRIIKINGKEYGFEPDLDKMSYGLYLDISSYKDLSINEDWSDIMSMLYRPITQKIAGQYEIESYKAQKNGELFLDVSMDVHLGALFFFINLRKDLLNSILKSLKDSEEMSPNIKSTLEKSGVDILR